jgi:hypothetical protein
MSLIVSDKFLARKKDIWIIEALPAVSQHQN